MTREDRFYLGFGRSVWSGDTVALTVKPPGDAAAGPPVVARNGRGLPLPLTKGGGGNRSSLSPLQRQLGGTPWL